MIDDCIEIKSFIEKEKNLLLNYKENDTIHTDSYEKVQVLNLLDKLGFPMDEIGTYLYKDVIMSALKDIEYKRSNDDILKGLNNFYSSTYQNIARDEYWIGVTTFHSLVKRAIDKVSLDNTDKMVVSKIFSEDDLDVNYGVKAFMIASYLYNNLDKEESKKMEK